MRATRTYSPQTKDVLSIFGNLIKVTRKEQRMPETELAERIGISRSTLQRIEAGDPKCEIGLVLEAASLLGIDLFGSEDKRSSIGIVLETKLALLPQSARRSKLSVQNDF